MVCSKAHIANFAELFGRGCENGTKLLDTETEQGGSAHSDASFLSLLVLFEKAFV